MKPIFDRYSRPFATFELGPAEGYFSHRIAEGYPGSVAVMAERNETLCAQVPGTVFLHRECSAADLMELSACEHFSVALAMSVLHHVPDPIGAFNAMMKLGDRLIFETPPPGDRVAWNGRTEVLWEAIQAVPNKELLAETKGMTPGIPRPLWLIPTPKIELQQPDLIRARSLRPPQSVRVTSTYDRKTVAFPDKGEPERDWVPGINLLTYMEWNGLYPDRETVAGWIEAIRLPERRHGDVRPWNMVLSRDHVELIDLHHHQTECDDLDGIRYTARAVRHSTSYWEGDGGEERSA